MIYERKVLPKLSWEANNIFITEFRGIELRCQLNRLWAEATSFEKLSHILMNLKFFWLTINFKSRKLWTRPVKIIKTYELFLDHIPSSSSASDPPSIFY